MDTKETKLMEQLETEVSELNRDMGKVREKVENVQTEMHKVTAVVGNVQTNVQQILNILSGNQAVHGDHGITGRLFEAEKRVRELEEWKARHADFVVSDYKSLKKRCEVLEQAKQKNRMLIGVWCGVATGLSVILQFVLKYIFHL